MNDQKNVEQKPKTEIMRWFHVGGHLPVGLPRAVMGLFMRVAEELDRELPNGPEKSAGLRKLLEAKDCCIRAAILGEHPDTGTTDGSAPGGG